MDCFVKMEDQDIYFINHHEDYFLTEIFSEQKACVSNQFQLNQDKKNCSSNSRTNFQQNSFLSKESKILSDLCNYVDLKSCHLSQIKNHLQKYFWEQNYNKKELFHLIVKEKLRIKRQQAKKRTQTKRKKLIHFSNKQQKNGSNKHNYIDLTEHQSNEIKSQIQIVENCKKEEQFIPYIFNNQNCDQIQKKKKRNRVSAQISRDKKKQYIKALEKEIEDLKEIKSINQKIMQEKQCLTHIVEQQSQRISQMYKFVEANQQINRNLIDQNLKLKQELQKVMFLLQQQNQTEIDMKVNMFAFKKLNS